ncbi:hypothetical protein N7523_000743, partial [Penicillium sp. IBT 18751x]
TALFISFDVLPAFRFIVGKLWLNAFLGIFDFLSAYGTIMLIGAIVLGLGVAILVISMAGWAAPGQALDRMANAAPERFKGHAVVLIQPSSTAIKLPFN